MLTAENLRSRYDYDPLTGVFTRRVSRSNSVKVGSAAGSASSDGYLRIWIDGHSYKAHRLAWLHAYGVWPTKQIDHLNGDRADNRIANLREADQPEQNANTRRRTNNTSGRRGVSLHKASGKYTARLSFRGRIVHCTYHDTPEEASAAYDAAFLAHYGSIETPNRT